MIDFLNKIETKYYCSFHNISDLEILFENFIFFAFFRHSEYYKIPYGDNINPKIIEYKSAFKNIGIEIRHPKTIIKKKLVLGREIVYFDFLKVPYEDISNNIYPLSNMNNIAIILKKNNIDDNDDTLFNFLEDEVIGYFSKKNGLSYFIDYIDKIISLNYSVPIFIKDLEENIKVMIISNKYIDSNIEIHSFNNSRYNSIFKASFEDISYFRRYQNFCLLKEIYSKNDKSKNSGSLVMNDWVNHPCTNGKKPLSSITAQDYMIQVLSTAPPLVRSNTKGSTMTMRLSCATIGLGIITLSRKA